MSVPGLSRSLVALLLGIVTLLSTASGAHGATRLEGWMQDDTLMLADPMGTLTTMRALGADHLRLSVRWADIAPDPARAHAPAGFRASDPAAYAPGRWAPFDRIVEDARQLGVTVDFNLVGGVPRWAEGPHEPAEATNQTWEPNASAFGSFVRAVGTRYSGTYDPVTETPDPGNPDDLPRVSFWSVWNEPDYGPSLAPQGLPGHLTVEHSPEMYRGLVDGAWSALRDTGHGSDSFLFGELAPRGKPFWGVFSGMKPLIFLRALYCVDAEYRPLHGAAAALRGCPTTATGSRAFASRNPGLFHATGFSDHPYSRYFPPNREYDNDPNYTSLADIGNLEHALNRVTSAYGVRTRFPIWNTEYGYITSPPKISPDRHSHPIEYYLSPTVAAAYLNQAEYMSYRDPRIRSFDQYLLRDPEPRTKATDYGGYASGLLAYSGAPKATFGAWEMPLYLPKTSQASHAALEVWGCVRPARFALSDVFDGPEVAQIELLRPGARGWTTVAEVPITNPDGYFDTHVTFPAGGAVRVSWTEPQSGDSPQPGIALTSRTVQITVR